MSPGAAPKVIALNDAGSMAAIRAVKVLRNGGVLALKADRLVDERTAAVPFFGRPIHLPTGPFLLAAISGAPIITLGCFKEGASTYRVMATEPRVLRFTSRKERAACLQRWAADYAAQLEAWARRYPHQWYNFHDVWDRQQARAQIPAPAPHST